MDSDSSRAANLAQRVADRFNATPDSGRHAAAIGVAEDDPGRAGPRGREADLGRVLGVTYEAVEEVLGVEDHLATKAHRVGDRLLDHRQVFVVRRLQHGRDLPGIAFAHECPYRSIALGERFEVGVLLAGPARAPGCAERRQPRVRERFRREAREQLLVLGV